MVTDGGTKNITIAGASMMGRARWLSYAAGRKVNAVTQGDRDFSWLRLLGWGRPAVRTTTPACGSSTPANGRFRRTTNGQRTFDAGLSLYR